MDEKELQDPEKVSAVWIKNLGRIANRINNTKSLMTSMEPQDAIKIDSARQGKTYPEEKLLPRDGLYIYLYPPRKQHEGLKIWAADFIWSKNT